MNFSCCMGLFKMRVRPRAKVLINVDLAVQECQQDLNDAKKELNVQVKYDYADSATRKEGSHTKEGTIYHFNRNQAEALDKFKRRLLATVKEVDKTIEELRKAGRDFAQTVE